jgi:hypothetical protein
MLLSPQEQRMTNQLLPRFTRFNDGQQRTLAVASVKNIGLYGHNSCNGRTYNFLMRALDHRILDRGSSPLIQHFHSR